MKLSGLLHVWLPLHVYAISFNGSFSSSSCSVCIIYMSTVVELIHDISWGTFILALNNIDTSPNTLIESILASIVPPELSSVSATNLSSSI